MCRALVLHFCEYLMFRLYGRQNIISVSSTGMETISEHSKHCDVRLCIHLVIWLNQKPFHSDLYPLSKSAYQSGSRTHLLTHATDTNTSGPSLCIPLEKEREKYVDHIAGYCLYVLCLGFLMEYFISGSVPLSL